jgi:5-methylcytosine-specific restriction endonuclease McrA
MRRETKAKQIPAAVKLRVLERDGGCIICSSSQASPNAHFVSRAQGGLGIEENIITLCDSCHKLFDQSPYRGEYRERIEKYLKSKYPNWDESKLIYKKG